MPTLWHPTIAAYEIFQSRVETWNDVNPQAVVTLEVQDQYYLATFVNDFVKNRYAWPFNSTTPFYLYASNIEVLPIDTKYTTDPATPEYIYTAAYPRKVRVTYSPRTEYLRNITISAGIGTATGSGYRTQAVWVGYSRLVSTENLTMDYNDFMWAPKYTAGVGYRAGDSLKPEEAPGRPLRTIKYVMSYRNIFLIEDLEDIVMNYSGTVNNSSLTLTQGGVTTTFEVGQVLFNIEDVQPSITGINPTLDWFGEAQFYNLKCSFHCRTGEGSWNKFWRAMSDTNSTVPGQEDDESGWYEMYHKPRGANINYANAAKFQPFAETNYWYPLWV